MTDPTQRTLTAKETQLLSERELHLAALRQIEDRLQFLHDLQAEVAASKNIKAEAAHIPHANSKTKSEHSSNGELLRPSEAIAAFLNEHPDARKTEIIKAVAHNIKTESKKPKEMIGTMIYQMTKRGRLIRKDGKYRVASPATH